MLSCVGEPLKRRHSARVKTFMDRVTAEKLISIWRRILELLSEANVLARAIPEEKDQKELRRALAQQMASITVDLLLPILRAYPDLDTNEEKPKPDPPLSSEEQVLVDQLSAAELEAIDEALLEDACDEWRKVARIVCTALGRLEDRIPGFRIFFTHNECVSLWRLAVWRRKAIYNP